jgi:hypothetical protein
MSYSFSVSGPTKSEVVTKAMTEIDNVVIAKPIHFPDRGPALAAISAFVHVLPDPSAEQIVCLTVCGSINWTDGGVITAASVYVSAWLASVDQSRELDDENHR